MKVLVTEYLRIDLAGERWECRRCDHDIGDARRSYKEGLLVYDREPADIHKPLLDTGKYAFTFTPDPRWCRILEYYCPSCGTMVETEYTVPGHPPVHDIEFDLDALKAQWAQRRPVTERTPAKDLPRPEGHHHHHHHHRHGHPED
ncbi:acetone carboxylase subunit gamma [Zavarzinia compransoris]|uniref:acetone carboxylase subunit gamma n=1 Tax=Zavarzinia compransoris TaxID=1264899 RepID=UPI0010E70FF2|nr:acetone carboxylase subunit gamma [Zavarzinia compransoris]TDP49312.1 acetone carboxylase gamma subunit [Zavarzinia compransoris]